MALNQMTSVAPRQESREPTERKKDWMERVLEGLQIAQGISGITRDVTTIQKNRLDTKAAEDAQAGYLTPAQLASAQASGLEIVEPGTKGTMPYKVRTGPGENDFRETPLMKAAKPPAPLGGSYQTVAGPDGKPVKKWLPNNGPDQPAYVPPKSTAEQLIVVQTTDAEGKPVQKVVPKTAGAEYPVAGGGATGKSDKERLYRYNALVQNATKLKDIIDKEGTAAFMGPEASNMDAKIYEMAIDYAKLVDPDSVAREGEVAAAKKYMLPFREFGGLTTRNSVAKEQIDNYIQSLDKRLEAQGLAAQGSRAATPPPGGDRSAGTAQAAPAASPPKPGEVVDGYRFKGGNPAEPANWERK